MNKFNFIIIILILVLGLGFIIYKQNTKISLLQSEIDSRDFEFNKNQECAKLLPAIKDAAEKKANPLGVVDILKIFYSPKLNSCLYVQRITTGVDKRLYWTINVYDALKNENLYSTMADDLDISRLDKIDEEIKNQFE